MASYGWMINLTGASIPVYSVGNGGPSTTQIGNLTKNECFVDGTISENPWEGDGMAVVFLNSSHAMTFGLIADYNSKLVDFTDYASNGTSWVSVNTLERKVQYATVAYYANGDFDKSLALLKNIPNDDLTLYQKALVYLKMGQTSRALAHALSIKEQGDKVKELLGDIWLALGDLKAAEGSFLVIPEKKRSAKVNFLLGVSCLEADRDRADQFFAKAEKMDPKYYKRAKDRYQSLLKLVSQKQGGQDKK